MIQFPPTSWPAWIILIGLVVSVLMFVVIPVAVPAGYGIRGVVRFIKRRGANKNTAEVTE